MPSWSALQNFLKAHPAFKDSLGQPDETAEDRAGEGMKTAAKWAVEDTPAKGDEITPSWDPMDVVPPEAAGLAAIKGLAALKGGSIAFPTLMGALRRTAGIVPNDAVRSVARDYMENKGLKELVEQPFAKVDPERAAKIAQAYEQMRHDPNHPDVKKAYDALINETVDQFRKLKSTGLNISTIKPGMANPYAEGSNALFNDIKNNKHMWYYPTESGFGTPGSVTQHPLLAPTSEQLDGKPLLANDVFRIVHDYFGHSKEGVGFGPRGEENAWREHMMMFTPEAQKALTTETRGQNSWVNFGPKGEANRANPANTVYADQKAGILPDWINKAEPEPEPVQYPLLKKSLQDDEEE